MTQIIKKIFYLASFSFVFIIILNFVNSSFFHNKTKIPKTNALKEYKILNIQPISQVWVAITTNIWMWKNNKWEINDIYINNEIFNINTFYNYPKKINKNLIKPNMLFIKEYYNIVKANFNNIIKKSTNREKTINNLIKQLKIRLQKANENLQNTTKQGNILKQEYEKLVTQIDNIKRKLENDFKQNKEWEVFTDIDKYYSLKNKQIIIKTNIVFINNFTKRYKLLNKQNSLLIDNIKLNKDIIIKNSHLIIPKSWTRLLKDFELLYTEDEFKNIQNKIKEMK